MICVYTHLVHDHMQDRHRLTTPSLLHNISELSVTISKKTQITACFRAKVQTCANTPKKNRKKTVRMCFFRSSFLQDLHIQTARVGWTQV